MCITGERSGDRGSSRRLVDGCLEPSQGRLEKMITNNGKARWSHGGSGSVSSRRSGAAANAPC